MIIDLYEITVSEIYYRDFSPDTIATFELWVRTLPCNRDYLVFCGLNDIVEYLRNFKFSSEDLTYLERCPSLKHLEKDFFGELAKTRFTGNLWAMNEGTVFFGNEPVIRIEAPIIEAQLIETALINLFSYSTNVLSKAIRIVKAVKSGGENREVLDFGVRRSPSLSSSLVVARASYIAGFNGTSNVEAGMRYGIPIVGTMPHSFILSHEDELLAFTNYLLSYPTTTILLVDTYDTLNAVKNISKLKDCKNIKAIRIDSGDFKKIIPKVRRILDSQGLQNIKIFISNDLDEYKILDLAHLPIDGFGVGTKLVTNDDCPNIGTIYKLVKLQEDGRMKYVSKFSDSKTTYPAAKQVYRIRDKNMDIICLDDENYDNIGESLLKKIISNGEIVEDLPKLDEIRSYVKTQKKYMMGREIIFSDRLKHLLEELRGKIICRK